MELVQAPQMIEKGFKGLGNGEELQEAVDDDVEDRQEAQAHVAKVNGQVLRLELHGGADLFGKALEVQLLRVFLGREWRSLPGRSALGSRRRWRRRRTLW